MNERVPDPDHEVPRRNTTADLQEDLRRGVASRLRSLDMAEIGPRFCLSARVGPVGEPAIGLLTNGTPVWATDPAHPHHQADTVHVEVGEAIGADGGCADKDDLVRRLAQALADRITARPGA